MLAGAVSSRLFRSKLTLALIIGGTVLVVVILRLTGSASPPSPTQTDFQNHPIYSRYTFENGENVINIGTQPTLLPTGLITEAMKRDAVLKENLESLGMKIRFYPFLKGSDINHFLELGMLDAGFAGDMPAIIAAANLDATSIALVQLGFVSIVADRLYPTSELRGKKIGYAVGSNAHFALIKTLDLEGISQNEVKLVPLDVDQMPQALSDGAIDAFAAWDPFPSVAEVIDDDAVVIQRTLGSGYFYLSDSFIEKHPDVVRYLAASVTRSIRWAQRDRQNMQAAARWSLDAHASLVPVTAGLSVDTITELALHDIFGMKVDPIIPDLNRSLNVLEEFFFLQRVGLLPQSAQWEDVRAKFDSETMKEILADSTGFRLNEFSFTASESQRP